MATLTEYLSHHHQACDALFADAENAAVAGHWDACLADAQAFVAAVAAHFDAEEEQVFPRCEAANPAASGPVAVMRGEHAMMRELLAELLGAAEARDEAAFRDAGDTLVILMQQHNLKEERILYPLCDRGIPGAPALADQLRETLEATAHV